MYLPTCTNDRNSGRLTYDGKGGDVESDPLEYGHAGVGVRRGRADTTPGRSYPSAVVRARVWL